MNYYIGTPYKIIVTIPITRPKLSSPLSESFMVTTSEKKTEVKRVLEVYAYKQTDELYRQVN